MGNTLAFVHRLPAIFTASFASCALALLATSGSVCDFLEIRAKNGNVLTVEDGTLPPSETSTFLGVICMNPWYQDLLHDDVMFIMSRVCLFAALAMASFTCVLAWSLASFLTPTQANWKLLSVFAAVAAILQMPVFLLFETDPCTLFPIDQECVLANGGMYLICSSVFWVVVAVATQLLDPPRWADELNAWRLKTPASTALVVYERNHGSFASIMQEDQEGDGDSQAPLLMAASKTSFLRRILLYIQPRDFKDELPLNHTASLSEGEKTVKYRTGGNFHDDSNPNHITEVAMVLYPSPTLDIRTLEHTSRHEDEYDHPPIRLLEEGRIVDYTTLAPPSMDGCSVANSQHTDNENCLQLVVWSGSFESQPTEQQVVDDIYADLENPHSTETQMVLAHTPGVNQHALLLKESPIKTTMNLKIPMTPTSPREDHPINESQIFRIDAPSMNQQAKLVHSPSETKTTISTTLLTKSTEEPTLMPQSTEETSLLPRKPKTPSKIMKSLAETLKRSRVGRTGVKNYSRMNDDDSVASTPLLPTEVFIRGYDETTLLQVRGSPTRQAEFPCFVSPTLTPLARSRSIDDDSYSNYPDPQITCMASLEGCSSEEDEPYPAISQCSSNEIDGDHGSVESANGDEDASSSSESSNGGERWRLALAQVKMTSNRRRSGGGYSSVRSIVSSTSVIDTIIDEETDDDLREHDHTSPYGFVRSMSAPSGIHYRSSSYLGRQTQVHLDGQTTMLLRQPTYFSDLDHSNLDGILLAPLTSCKSLSPYSGRKGGIAICEEFRSKCYPENISRFSVPVSAPDIDDPLIDIGLLYSRESHSQSEKDEQFDVDLERLGSYLSHPGDEVDINAPGPVGPVSDLAGSASKASGADYVAWREEPEGKNYLFGSASVVSASPTYTAPETPSPNRYTRETSHHDTSILSLDSERSWKEDREIRGGIHAAPVPDSPGCNEEASSARDRVRQARIRRLQLEKGKRIRSPGQACVNVVWQETNESSMASIVDKLDLQLIEVLRPLGVEYGPDESSL